MSKSIKEVFTTEEIKLLVFRLRRTLFAIDVMNTREIIKQVKTVEIPNAPGGIAGVFKLRDEVLPLVKLGEYLGFENDESDNKERAIIIVEACGTKYGMIVDAVDVIKAVSTESVQPQSEFLQNSEAPIIGTVEIDGKTIQIPDLEQITGELFSTEAIDTLKEAGAEIEEPVLEATGGRTSANDGTPSFDTMLGDIPTDELQEATAAIAEQWPDDDSK